MKSLSLVIGISISIIFSSLEFTEGSSSKIIGLPIAFFMQHKGKKMFNRLQLSLYFTTILLFKKKIKNLLGRVSERSFAFSEDVIAVFWLNWLK